MATPLAKTETPVIQKTNLEEPEDEGVEEEEEELEEELEEEEEEPVEKITQKDIKNIGHVFPEDEVEDDSVEDVIDEEEEDIIEEEEEEEDDISEELDDSDLMKKLEEKYGKLPQLEDDQPEGHSDDDTPITPSRKSIVLLYSCAIFICPFRYKFNSSITIIFPIFIFINFSPLFTTILCFQWILKVKVYNNCCSGQKLLNTLVFVANLVFEFVTEGKPSGGNTAQGSDRDEEPDENAVNWKHQYDLAQAEMDEVFSFCNYIIL